MPDKRMSDKRMSDKRLSDKRRPEKRSSKDRTAGVGPSWFTIDQVFKGIGGWYVGSRDGFSIGPYHTEQEARAEAGELGRRLDEAGNVSDVLQLVCQVLEKRQQNSAGQRRFGRMNPVRAGEPARLGYRSPRRFALYGRWYFMTREGIDVGPYPSREAAEQAETRLVERLLRCENERERRSAIYEFVAASRG